MSQEAFADMCQLDRTYIGGIERGERNVALVNIEKIAKTLGFRLRSFSGACDRLAPIVLLAFLSRRRGFYDSWP